MSCITLLKQPPSPAYIHASQNIEWHKTLYITIVMYILDILEALALRDFGPP